LEQIGGGLHLRLFSRAFVVQANPSSRPVVFVNLDAGMSSQLLKTQVVERLKTEYGSIFDHDNVMLSATHTHSGPAGFFQYALFYITSLGFVRETLDAMVNGIVQSIQMAYASLTPGRILFGEGILKNASINRSPLSYLNNPSSERSRYSANVDQEMTLLKFLADDGRELGMISWFSVHGTSMNNTNRLVSSDNKGMASVLFEQWMNGPEREVGRGPFVAAFAQANEGDVSPNTRGARCIDTGLPCDELTSTCARRVSSLAARRLCYHFSAAIALMSLVRQNMRPVRKHTVCRQGQIQLTSG
uniref:Neutral ceramidase n=1 Tax=Schistocephalus solidus TaxID=70667 RepID=A0A183TK10_SCHSO